MIGRHEPCLSPPEAAWRAHRSLLPGTPRFIAQKQARGPAAWFRRRPESVDQPACCLACAAVGFPDHQRRRPRPSAHGAMFNGPALHVWRRVLTQRSANAAVPARFVYGASSLLSTVTFGVASAALANQKPRILRRGLCRFELQIRRLGPTDAVSFARRIPADSSLRGVDCRTGRTAVGRASRTWSPSTAACWSRARLRRRRRWDARA